MDLGDLGEKSFARWCAEVDLCASRPDRDRTGWDYLVEFPARRTTEAVPLDLAPPELTCKIQVKATRKVVAFPPISLANWKRLVQAPIPAFVVLIKFDGQTTAEEVYLLHVDERVTREVLKRLRELDADERPHKRRFKPPLDWATRLSSASGNGLAEQIRVAIGVSVKDYYHRKLKWLADVGYEDGNARFSGTMSLGSEDNYDALVDFAIGLRDTLPFVMAEVSDLRFGIPRPIERGPRGEGYLSIQPLPSAMRATMQFASSDGRVMASLPTEVFSPTTLFPFIPKDKVRIRFRHPFMEVLYCAGTGKVSFTYNFPPGKSRPLAELHAVAQVVRVLDEVRRSPTGELHLSFFFEHGGTARVVSSIRDAPDFNSLALEISGAITAAAEVWSAFNLGQAPDVEVGQLLEDQRRLLLMASLLSRRPFRVTDYTVSASLKPPCRVGAPFTLSCEVGDRLVTVVGALVGDCEGEGPDAEGYYKLRMSNPEPRVFERDCRPVSSRSFDAKSALRRAVKSVETIGLECILAGEYQGPDEASAGA